jgi:hypothetical protein
MPDGTAGELCWEYNRRVPRAARTNESSLRRALARAGFVYKKNVIGRANSIARRSRPNAWHS